MMSSAGRLEVVSRLTDSLIGKFSILDAIQSTNADGAIHFSPESIKKKSLRSPANARSTNSNKRESGSSTGFFLTGAVENYDEDSFEVEDTPESSNANCTRSSGDVILTEGGSCSKTAKSLSAQSQNKKLSLRYEKEINDSMLRSFDNLLASTAKSLDVEKPGKESFSDDALSKLHKRLEEATSLEYLIEQNQIRENTIFEPTRPHKKGAVKISNSGNSGYLLKSSSSDKLSLVNRQSSVVPILNQRKKAWEDPLHNKDTYGKLRVNPNIPSLRTGQNIHKSTKLNLLMEKLSKNKNFNSSNTDKLKKNKTFDNSELRNKIYGATDKLNSANKFSRINSQVELDRKLRNRRDKKESLSSQLGGRIRNEKGTAEMRPSAKDSTFDNSHLPRIDDRKKKVLNESLQNRSHKIKSTFMTDFSSLDFDMNKGNDVIDKKEKENLIIRRKRTTLEMNNGIRNKIAKHKKIDSQCLSRVDGHLRSNTTDENTKRVGHRIDRDLGPIVPGRNSRSQHSPDRNMIGVEVVKIKDKNACTRHEAYDQEKRVSYASKSVDKKSLSVSMKRIAVEGLVTPSTSHMGPCVVNNNNAGDKVNQSKIPLHRPTNEIIDLLSQVEIKEHGRQRAHTGNKAEGDTATAQLMKHAKRLGSHWAAAESYATKYNSLEDDD